MHKSSRAPTKLANARESKRTNKSLFENDRAIEYDFDEITYWTSVQPIHRGSTTAKASSICKKPEAKEKGEQLWQDRPQRRRHFSLLVSGTRRAAQG
jgi:hypothetical protein